MYEYFVFEIKPEPTIGRKPYVGVQCISGLNEEAAKQMLPSRANKVIRVQARNAKEAAKKYVI